MKIEEYSVNNAERIRELFSTPTSDYLFVEMDGAGMQLRIGAAHSDDPEMRYIFTEGGGDMHSLTAQSVFRRDLTVEEFFQKKKDGEKDVKDKRQKSKAVNFGLEFGSSAFAFATNTLFDTWSEDEVNSYIEENGISDRKISRLLEIVEDKDSGNRDDPFPEYVRTWKFCKYWACAIDIRNKFFDKYKGLHRWVERMPDAAIEWGFVRSPFGSVRRFPELFYEPYYEENAKKKLKSLKNEAINSPVQTHESVIVYSYLYAGLSDYVKEHNMRSIVCFSVHDSIVAYVHKDEAYEFLSEAAELFEQDLPENFGIPMKIEFDVSDYFQGEVWGYGREMELEDIQKEYAQ